VSTAADNHTYVVFRIDAQTYALPVDVVTSVVRFTAPTPVPRAPRSVMGVINLRGRVLPIIDLKARFRSGAFAPGVNARIVVAEGPAGAVGVAVDAATDVARFSAEEMRPVPDAVLAPETSSAFAGIVEREDGLIILLDPDHTMIADDTRPPTTDLSHARKDAGSHV
jgi:purine-binding chemotaxis protein CheW